MYPDSCGPPNKFHTSSTEQKNVPHTHTAYTYNTRGSHQEQSIGYETENMIWYDIYDMKIGITPNQQETTTTVYVH